MVQQTEPMPKFLAEPSWLELRRMKQKSCMKCSPFQVLNVCVGLTKSVKTSNSRLENLNSLYLIDFEGFMFYVT